MPNRIEITTYPRIHITLIGMNSGGYRINGGIGFAINNPFLKIAMVPSKNVEIKDARRNKFNANEIRRLASILENARIEFELKNAISLTIHASDIATHYGFGTSTMIRLASLEGLMRLNNYHIDKSTLIDLSKRGGTSGIGIQTYFDGGLIFDMGRRVTKKSENKLAPSSHNERQLLVSPLMVQRLEMPDWKFGICLPFSIPNLTESEEVNFFNEICPINDSDCFETLYHCMYGILGSVLERDIDCFEEALNNIQKTKWKKSEIKLYGDQLKSLIDYLYEAGAKSVAMSSLGPGLIFTSNEIDEMVANLKKQRKDALFHIAFPRNSGRSIDYV